MLDLSIVSMMSSSSGNDTGWSAASMVRSIRILLAVGRTPFLSSIMLSFSVFMPVFCYMSSIV